MSETERCAHPGGHRATFVPDPGKSDITRDEVKRMVVDAITARLPQGVALGPGEFVAKPTAPGAVAPQCL